MSEPHLPERGLLLIELYGIEITPVHRRTPVHCRLLIELYGIEIAVNAKKKELEEVLLIELYGIEIKGVIEACDKMLTFNRTIWN